jgi:diphthamide synthase (EF-2-diphthine--ammonia ligase)
MKRGIEGDQQVKFFMTLVIVVTLSAGCACGGKTGGHQAMIPSPVEKTCGGFYNVAHMVNSPCLIKWAISQGANAVEIDLELGEDGTYNEFHHAGLRDCSLPFVGGVCDADECSARASVDEMIRYIAAQPGIALVIIDAKASKVKPEQLGHSGDRLASEVIRALYRQQYTGNLIVSVPKLSQVTMLAASYENIRTQAPELLSRVRFTVDGENGNTEGVIAALSGMASQNVYGTGITSLWLGSYQKEIKRAKSLGMKFTYVWTIDRQCSMNAYIDDGVDAIITNHPARLREIAEQRGLRLVRSGDGWACP